MGQTLVGGGWPTSSAVAPKGIIRSGAGWHVPARARRRCLRSRLVRMRAWWAVTSANPGGVPRWRFNDVPPPHAPESAMSGHWWTTGS